MPGWKNLTLLLILLLKLCFASFCNNCSSILCFPLALLSSELCMGLGSSDSLELEVHSCCIPWWFCSISCLKSCMVCSPTFILCFSPALLSSESCVGLGSPNSLELDVHNCCTLWWICSITSLSSFCWLWIKPKPLVRSSSIFLHSSSFKTHSLSDCS